MAYRVVYGETMPTWEKTFPTKREADAFARRHKLMGDIVFSVLKVIPNDPKHYSLMARLDAMDGGSTNR